MLGKVVFFEIDSQACLFYLFLALHRVTQHAALAFACQTQAAKSNNTYENIILSNAIKRPVKSNVIQQMISKPSSKIV